MMKKQVFIINGAGGSGKDTFIDLLSEVSGREITKVSSVDEIKIIAEVFFDWNGVKDLKSRKLLSDLKKLQSEYCDGPMKYMRQAVYGSKENIIFLFIREPDEIKKAAEEFNAKTLLITRKNLEPVYGNSSDDNVRNYKYDYLILNNGSMSVLKDAAIYFNEKYL